MLFESSPDSATAFLRAFDAVWFLSDRGSSTRLSLPFGPARSAKTAATHFKILLAHTSGKSPQELQRRRPAETVNLISSAVGRQSSRKLVEAAISRMLHFNVDLAPSPQIYIHSEGSVPELTDGYTYAASPHFPEAEQAINTHSSFGVGSAALIAEGARIRLANGREFISYCQNLIGASGFSIDGSAGRLYLDPSCKEAVRYRCLFTPREKLPTLRTRVRRQQVDDLLLIVNEQVGRRTFVVQLLNGVIPLHYSKIPAIRIIHSNRYMYAIRYVASIPPKRTKESSTLLVPAALDILNALIWGASDDLGQIFHDPT